MKFYSNNLSFIKGIVLLIVLGGVVGYFLSLKISPLLGPKEVFSFQHVGEVSCVAFSPDGKYLVAGSKGIVRKGIGIKHWVGELLVWEMATKKQVASLSLPFWAQSLSFSPKGDLLAIGCGLVWYSSREIFTDKSGELLIYDFPALKERMRIIEDSVFYQVRFSPDGKIFVSSNLGKVQIWDTATLKVKYSLKELNYLAVFFSISPDSQVLAVGDAFPDNFEKTSHRGIVKVYDLGSGKEKYVLPKEEGIVDFVAFSPLENLLGLTLNRRIILREVKTGKEVTPPEFSKVFFYFTTRHMTFSPDGKLLAAICHSGGGRGPQGRLWVVIWNMAEKKLHQQWQWPETADPLTSFTFSPDSKLLAIGTRGRGERDAEVKIFSISPMPR